MLMLFTLRSHLTQTARPTVWFPGISQQLNDDNISNCVYDAEIDIDDNIWFHCWRQYWYSWQYKIVLMVLISILMTTYDCVGDADIILMTIYDCVGDADIDINDNIRLCWRCCLCVASSLSCWSCDTSSCLALSEAQQNISQAGVVTGGDWWWLVVTQWSSSLSKIITSHSRFHSQLTGCR